MEKSRLDAQQPLQTVKLLPAFNANLIDLSSVTTFEPHAKQEGIFNIAFDGRFCRGRQKRFKADPRLTSVVNIML